MILEKWKVVYRQKTKVYRTTVRTNIYIYRQHTILPGGYIYIYPFSHIIFWRMQLTLQRSLPKISMFNSFVA